jgi:2,4-dienoyl-CoA reductase-like NADH-dependent reductase (Old Yellow Enzyme family)
MRLLEPLALRGVTAPNRVLFGPIVTTLADDDRRFTATHGAF